MYNLGIIGEAKLAALEKIPDIKTLFDGKNVIEASKLISQRNILFAYRAKPHDGWCAVTGLNKKEIDALTNHSQMMADTAWYYYNNTPLN